MVEAVARYKRVDGVTDSLEKIAASMGGNYSAYLMDVVSEALPR